MVYKELFLSSGAPVTIPQSTNFPPRNFPPEWLPFMLFYKYYINKMTHTGSQRCYTCTTQVCRENLKTHDARDFIITDTERERTMTG